MAARQPSPCLRCGDIIDINEAGIVADIRLRTVGIEDGVRSPQASVYMCVTCTDLAAKGDEPPQRTRPLDHVVYELIQEMVTNDPRITFLSWIELRKTRGLPAASFVDPKVMKAWNEFRKVLALPPTLEQGGEEEGPILPARRLKEVS